MSKITRTITQIKNELAGRSFILIDDIYLGMNYKYNFLCNICNRQWISTLSNIIYFNRGCSACAGRTKHTLDFIKNEYLICDILFVSEIYVNSSSNHDLQCKICDCIWKACYNSFKQQHAGCPDCSDKKRHTKDTISKIYNKLGFEFIDNVYINFRTKHKTRCLTCDFIWFPTPGNIISNRSGCPDCSGWKRYTPQEIIELFLIKKFKIIDDNFILNYRRADVPVLTRCLTCQHEWCPRPSAIINNKSGCPRCNARQNEKLMLNILQKLLPNVKISKKTIECSGFLTQKKIFCDAAFKINNTEFIIEYNGEQHYRLVLFGGKKYINKSQKNFERQVKRDEYLRKYCKENNITLIEIDGREYFSEGIEPYITEQLHINGILGLKTGYK